MLILGFSIISASASSAQSVVIDSLDSTGQLTATVPSNSVYSVEWIGALDSSNGWQKAWGHLRDLESEDGNVDVEVPMAYRLTCWTNGVFLNAPIGRTFHYKVTNGAPTNNVWRQEIKVLGDTYMGDTDEVYRMVSVVEYYGHADNPPIGAQSRGTLLLRSDETMSHHFDVYYNTEYSAWREGTNGTQWAYFSSQVETTNDAVILAHEDIDITTTNGVVTYEDCVKIYTEGRTNGFAWQQAFPVRDYTEWIKPGGFVVKSENNWLFYTAETAAEVAAASPVVYELQGWTDQ